MPELKKVLRLPRLPQFVWKGAWTAPMCALLCVAGACSKAPPPAESPRSTSVAPDAAVAPEAAPSKVVFRDAQGHVLTEADLQGADGRVRWELVGAEHIPVEAQKLHLEGQEQGARREYAKAVVSFYEASKLAPQWPYPVYDAAFTYLLAGNSTKAEELYARTLELSPRGFFTAMTAVDTLRRERAGTLPKGTYLQFLSLESEKYASKRAALLQEMTMRTPTFAPVWEKLSGELKEESEQLDALEKGLKANPDPSSTLATVAAAKSALAFCLR